MSDEKVNMGCVSDFECLLSCFPPDTELRFRLDGKEGKPVEYNYSSADGTLMIEIA